MSIWERAKAFMADKENVLKASLIVVILLALFNMLFAPAITGYAPYGKDYKDNKRIDYLEEKVFVLADNFSSLLMENKNLMSVEEENLEKIKDLELSFFSLEKNFSSFALHQRKEVASLRDSFGNFTKNQGSVEQLKESYNALAQNSANNICCKAKVDNPKINFYDVRDDRIVCLEEGGFALSCS